MVKVWGHPVPPLTAYSVLCNLGKSWALQSILSLKEGENVLR